MQLADLVVDASADDSRAPIGVCERMRLSGLQSGCHQRLNHRTERQLSRRPRQQQQDNRTRYGVRQHCRQIAGGGGRLGHCHYGHDVIRFR